VVEFIHLMSADILTPSQGRLSDRHRMSGRLRFSHMSQEHRQTANWQELEDMCTALKMNTIKGLTIASVVKYRYQEIWAKNS